MPHSAWDHRDVVDEGLHDENSSDSETGRSRSLVKRKRRSTSNACFLSLQVHTGWYREPVPLANSVRWSTRRNSLERIPPTSRVCSAICSSSVRATRAASGRCRSGRTGQGGCRATPRTETAWHLRWLGQIGASEPARLRRERVPSSHPNRERPGHGSSLAESCSTWLVVRGLHWGTYTRPSKYA